MNRDEMARHLYVHAHDDQGAPQSWRDAGAEEWDEGGAKPEDVEACYRQADDAIQALIGDPA